MNLKFVTLIARIVICSLALAACGTPAPEQAEAEETQLEGSNEPIVTTFEHAPGSYSGTEGTYIIDCKLGSRDSCTATVSTNTVCLGTSNAGWVEIKPSVSVSHNRYVSETRLFSENADGSWVITANPIPYTVQKRDPEQFTCLPEVVFTVLLPSGGSVTKFP